MNKIIDFFLITIKSQNIKIGFDEYFWINWKEINNPKIFHDIQWDFKNFVVS